MTMTAGRHHKAKRIARFSLAWITVCALSVHRVKRDAIYSSHEVPRLALPAVVAEAEGAFAALSNATFAFSVAPGCEHLGLDDHPQRITSGRARFAVSYCKKGDRMHPDNGGAEVLAKWPARTPANPYVVFVAGLSLDGCSRHFTKQCRAWHDLFVRRNDFLYVALDRADARLCDNAFGQLPGLAILPNDPAVMDASLPPDEVLRRSRLLFFSGTNHAGWYGSSMVRPWLFRAYANWTRSRAAAGDDILISRSVPPSDYHLHLRETRFALIPHGDGRWNYRLADVLQAGAVPVFLADGFEPPYAPLVRWDGASVRLPEMAARDLGAVRRALLSLPADAVARMGRNVQEIYRACFETATKRAACLVKSLQILIERGTFTEPPVQLAERLRLALCPSDKRFTDDSGLVRYENNTFQTWHTLY